MNRARTVTANVVALVVVGLAVGGCSGGGDGEPGLDRIDGPAQVDPDVRVGGSSDGSDG